MGRLRIDIGEEGTDSVGEEGSGEVGGSGAVGGGELGGGGGERRYKRIVRRVRKRGRAEWSCLYRICMLHQTMR